MKTISKEDLRDIVRRNLTYDTQAIGCDITLLEAVYEELRPGIGSMPFAYVNGLVKLKALPSMEEINVIKYSIKNQTKTMELIKT